MTDVINVMPPELTISDLQSSAAFVESRVFEEFSPTGASIFGNLPQATGYKSTINIDSGNAEYFLDGMQSYIKCKLSVRATINGAAANGDFVRVFLDEGGIHSLINRMELRLRNGTLIEDIQNYNKLYAIMRNATQSQANVESVESLECGDSMGWKNYIDPYNAYADDEKLTDANDAKLPANSLILNPRRRQLGASAVSAGVGAVAGAIVENTITFKPMMNFLSHIKYIPLPLLRELQLIIHWERADIGMFMKKTLANGTVNQTIAAGDLIEYNIENLRFVGNLVKPKQEILDIYYKAFEGSGISLPYVSHEVFSSGLTNTSNNVELQMSKNSCRYVLMTIIEDEANTEGVNARGYQSNSMFLKDTMTSYAVKLGGKRYPDFSPVNVNTRFAGEAFSQLMVALNQHKNTLLDTSIRSWELDEEYTHIVNRPAAANLNDARKFIVGVDLTNIDDFSGCNTTGSNLIVQLSFSQAPAGGGAAQAQTRNLLAFVGFDRVLTISKAFGTIIRD